MDRELRQFRDAAEGLRLVPVDAVLMALKRTARDAARALGKEVNFESQGGDIRLDADVLGSIQGALIQIVRNAVAHGIETEERAAGRRQAGGRSASRSTFPAAGERLFSNAATTGAASIWAAVRKARGAAQASRSGRSRTRAPRSWFALLLRGGISTSAAVTERLRPRRRPRRRARGGRNGSAAKFPFIPSPARARHSSSADPRFGHLRCRADGRAAPTAANGGDAARLRAPHRAPGSPAKLPTAGRRVDSP